MVGKKRLKTKFLCPNSAIRVLVFYLYNIIFLYMHIFIVINT